MFADTSNVFENVGMAVRVKDDLEDLTAGTHTFALRPKLEFVSDLLRRYTYTLHWKEQMRKLSSGNTVVGVDRKKLELAKMPLPTFPEQKALSNALDAMDLVEELEQERLQLLKTKKEIMLHSIFSVQS